MNTQLLINGEHRAAADGRSYDRSDPVTGAGASTAAAAGDGDALAAVAAAHAAFPGWSRRAPCRPQPSRSRMRATWWSSTQATRRS